MDAQQLISEFLSSDHGAQATQALAAQGINADDAQQMLSHAVDVTHAHVQEQSAASEESHTGRNFFAGFAAGLVRGDGFFKSLVDGGEGILTGKVASAVAERMGIDPGTASTVAAAATPYITAFLKEKLA
jgi:hypothetical protein